MNNSKSHLWVEKFRPKDIKNIVQQDEIKILLQQAIEMKNLTHMLFYGPPGTGKTSAALALAKQLFTIPKKDDEDLWTNYQINEKIFKERVMELNASDERGIKVVREKIKNFASSSINMFNKDINIPNFKIIILDEADAMTSDSQFALRHIIEKYTNMTRFILICNYNTRIISPLTSRCAKFRFQSISIPSIKIIINKIIKQEHIDITDNAIEELHKITKGDLRKVINILQRTSYINKTIDVNTIINIAGYIPPDVISNIWNNLSSSNNISYIMNLVKEFHSNAYSTINLLNNLFECVINSDQINDKYKKKLILIMSNIDNNLNENSNEFIQLMSLFVNINNILFITT